MMQTDGDRDGRRRWSRETFLKMPPFSCFNGKLLSEPEACLVFLFFFSFKIYFPVNLALFSAFPFASTTKTGYPILPCVMATHVNACAPVA